MSVIHRKTWYDVWDQKGRTLQVVLIIAIGAFAIGATLGALEFISRDITGVWRGINPPMIGLWVDPAIDEAMIESLAHLDGVAIVEGELEEGIKWRRSPAEPWQPATLMAREDYEDQQLNRLALDTGNWPQRKFMAVERGFDLGLGDQVYLEIDEKVYEVDLGGVVYNATVAPATFGGDPVFYTTRERFGQVTGEVNFTHFFATIPTYDPETIITVADRIQAHLEKQEFEVGAALPNGDRTADPTEHFIQEDLNGVFFILVIMAGVSLILGLFLVYNTITAIVRQQVNQIGIMKAIGATFGQVILVFFSQVIFYASLALLLAVPLGALGAQGLRVLLVGLFNMEPGPLELLPHVMLVQAVVALLSPVVVAIVPVLLGAQITVREAISTYGLGGTATLLERLLIQVSRMPHTLTLTISNTFRHKWRVVLTQVALAGSGLIFMMVMNAHASLLYTFSDVLFSIIDANVFLNFEDKQRIQTVEKLALAYPGVTGAEMWAFAGGTLRPARQPETNDDPGADIRGVPVPTEMYKPELRGGRWLEPDDVYAVVLHQKLAEELGVAVGDWVTLSMSLKRESQWQVVGLEFSPFNDSAATVPRDTLLKELHEVGLASHIRLKTAGQDATSEAAVARGLRQLYETTGYAIRPSSEDTAHQLTQNIMGGGIAIVINLLVAMAVIIALVGAVSLSGVLSINVLERRREIGVLRAIGASNLHIMQIFVGEGLLLAWLSWLIAWPLSIPAGRLMVGGLQAIIGDELSYATSPMGALYWLGIVTVLAVAASWFPARSATRVSVRESLAYQ